MLTAKASSAHVGICDPYTSGLQMRALGCIHHGYMTARGLEFCFSEGLRLATGAGSLRGCSH